MLQLMMRIAKELRQDLTNTDPLNILCLVIGLFLGLILAIVFLPFDFSVFARTYGTLVAGLITASGIVTAAYIGILQMRHSEHQQEARSKRAAIAALLHSLYEFQDATQTLLRLANIALGPPIKDTDLGQELGLRISYKEIPRGVLLIETASVTNELKWNNEFRSLVRLQHRFDKQLPRDTALLAEHDPLLHKEITRLANAAVLTVRSIGFAEEVDHTRSSAITAVLNSSLLYASHLNAIRFHLNTHYPPTHRLDAEYQFQLNRIDQRSTWLHADKAHRKNS